MGVRGRTVREGQCLVHERHGPWPANVAGAEIVTG